MSRLLVALIESLGRHDKGGPSHAPNWPHGTSRSAFGPTPLGAEIARILAEDMPKPQPFARDSVTGLPMYDDVPTSAAASAPGRFVQSAQPEDPRTPRVSPPPVAPNVPPPKPIPAPPKPVAPAPRVTKPTAPATTRTLRDATPPTAPAPPPAADRVPIWQIPFIAAPGVRYMRTPDRLLRRAREADAAITPIEPENPIVSHDFPVVSEPDAAIDETIEVTEEAEGLDIENRVAPDVRCPLPQRVRMMTGFAVEVPRPANDVADPFEDVQMSMSAPAVKPAFAVSVRPKSKPGAVAAVEAATRKPAPAKRKAPVAVAWNYPSVDLLGEPRKSEGQTLTADVLEQNARMLESTLEDFGIRGEIIHVRAGPVVTLYELEPAPGMKSSRVIGLADDIARSMSAVSARVAVVPGRNAIGIELPNERRETVFFREMVESAAFKETPHKLAIALGKTIGGEPVVAELAKMPHLLVAGTTGSGKSVAINTMILSLLYRLKPEECRLIMVDPKMLELSIYDGIPHLLTPVVTDPKKAVVALKWAVREMEDRYKKMSKVGVRNIDGFNARINQAKASGETITMQVTTGFDKETGKPICEEQPLDLVTLPYIVVIVDEMADLMMVAGKDIEGAIQRLAQMARAAGIHLIMATQRPSVDVITGTIKANFPTRISFQVTSKIDSRTILGEQGAEQLLGQGDMLHMQGGGRIYRVHGPFVSDAEVEAVVVHLKTLGQPNYLDAVTDDIEAEASADDDEGADEAVFDKTAMGLDEDGDLYEQAVKIVLRDKKSSVSYVQRRLSVGYNKAASLVERMEKEGVLSAASHTGKREILAHSRARVITGVPMEGEV